MASAIQVGNWAKAAEMAAGPASTFERNSYGLWNRVSSVRQHDVAAFVGKSPEQLTNSVAYVNDSLRHLRGQLTSMGSVEGLAAPARERIQQAIELLTPTDGSYESLAKVLGDSSIMDRAATHITAAGTEARAPYNKAMTQLNELLLAH